METLGEIEGIKGEHPLWGYRRVWAYMKYRLGIRINRKRVYRIMKENNLLVKRNEKLRAIRSNNNRSKPVSDKANRYWGTDMTKIKIGNYGWIYLVLVLDWCTKEIIGYDCSIRSTTSDWKEALDRAVNNRYPNGIREGEHPPMLISDNGCQPTSEAYKNHCKVLGIRQIFTSYNNPKGNADTERVIRTLKEDLVWTREWDNVFEFKETLNKWIVDYNEDYPHQTLGYKTPSQFYRESVMRNNANYQVTPLSKLPLQKSLFS